MFHGSTKVIDEDGSDSSASGSEVMLSSIIQRHDKADADLKTIMYGHVCTHLGGCKYKVQGIPGEKRFYTFGDARDALLLVRSRSHFSSRFKLCMNVTYMEEVKQIRPCGISIIAMRKELITADGIHFSQMGEDEHKKD